MKEKPCLRALLPRVSCPEVLPLQVPQMLPKASSDLVTAVWQHRFSFWPTEREVWDEKEQGEFQISIPVTRKQPHRGGLVLQGRAGDVGMLPRPAMESDVWEVQEWKDLDEFSKAETLMKRMQKPCSFTASTKVTKKSSSWVMSAPSCPSSRWH